MEKATTTVKRLLKELEKRKTFYFGSKGHEKLVEQYVAELAGEDLSMLSSAVLARDYSLTYRELDSITKKRKAKKGII